MPKKQVNYRYKAKEGDTLKIGDVIATIDSDVAVEPVHLQVIQQQTKPPTKTETCSAQAPVTTVPNDVKASPVAAAMIADKKVETSSITPSGAGGKIMKNDVLQALLIPGKKQ